MQVKSEAKKRLGASAELHKGGKTEHLLEDSMPKL